MALPDSTSTGFGRKLDWWLRPELQPTGWECSIELGTILWLREAQMKDCYGFVNSAKLGCRFCKKVAFMAVIRVFWISFWAQEALRDSGRDELPRAAQKMSAVRLRLRLTLFASRCYSRRVPFGRGFSVKRPTAGIVSSSLARVSPPQPNDSSSSPPSRSRIPPH